MHHRDTSGLRNHAQNKRRETFRRVEQGIQQLVKEDRPINFSTVAEASGVSRAWLNKEPDIQKRIQFLRTQQTPKKGVPPSQKASDASNTAKVKTLLQEVKKLRAENQGLRHHIEEILGRAVYADEQTERLRKETKALRKENAELKRQLNQHRSQNATNQASNMINLTQRDTVGEKVSEDKANRVEHQATSLGIKLNSTLRKVIEGASEEVVLAVLKALKEAMVDGAIKNPTGWLKRAIEGGWQPSDNYAQTGELTRFNEWFLLAREKGLVIASTKNGEEILVLTPDDEWVPFAEALILHPFENLEWDG